MYKPEPIDTKDIILPNDISELVEVLAKNTHEVWSKGRIANGWTYGPERNDARLQTPCLVEYEALTEEEKDYDRQTATETLKLIIKLGYKISKDPEC